MTTRIALLDSLRGLTLLSMITYHTMWDIVYLAGIRIGWYTALPGYLWQQSICWCFILLSGFCLQLGHHPVRRGLIVWSAGALVTAVTLLFDPAAPIWFGVLTLLGSCMILAGLLKPLLTHLPAAFGLMLNAALFLLTRNVNRGSLGFEGAVLVRLPAFFYGKTAASPFGFLMTGLGFPAADFISVDYFSLIPWFFLFLCGFYLYPLLRPQMERAAARSGEYRTAALSAQDSVGTLSAQDRAGTEKTAPRPRLRGFLAFLGRHSLLIYLLHQPAVYGILLLWPGLL